MAVASENKPIIGNNAFEALETYSHCLAMRNGDALKMQSNVQ